MYDPDQEAPAEGTATTINGISGECLKQYIERIERLEEEKAGIAEDISDTYAEAKGNGFDTKIMRQIVRLRKLDRSELEEQDALLELYRRAIGMSEEDYPVTEDRIRAVAHNHGIYNEDVIGEVAKQLEEEC